MLRKIQSQVESLDKPFLAPKACATDNCDDGFGTWKRDAIFSNRDIQQNHKLLNIDMYQIITMYGPFYGRCLSWAEDLNVQFEPCNDGIRQRWVTQACPGDHVHIIAVNAKNRRQTRVPSKCLAVPNQFATPQGIASGGPISAVLVDCADCSGGDGTQNFKFVLP